jgi:DNA-binding IclR family transcriptional regulator
LPPFRRCRRAYRKARPRCIATWLVETELVIQEASNGRYVLGPEAIAIGLAAMRQSDVLTLAANEISKLAEPPAIVFRGGAW